MAENFEHYISKNIKAYYRRRLFSPVIYLIILLILSIIFPLKNMTFPTTIREGQSLGKLYEQKQYFVDVTLHDLYFTGYKKDWMGFNIGYFYYTMYEDDCIIVLLKPSTSQQGAPEIKELTITGQILPNAASEDMLLENLAEDLSWTSTGIKKTISSTMLSEPDGNGVRTALLRAFLILSSLYSVLSIFIYFIYILRPDFSPAIRKLSPYGRPKKILEVAEEELLTLPQLATDDMFITEHFFIETSNYGVAIVPIQEIIWIYKYSTLHKFLWHHFSISYTLYITAGKRQYIKCPKNTKTDIDGIMDYLAEANHNILVGFSEENRKTVEEIQGDLIPLRKIWDFLSQKV
ncbi:MAG: hypothetical protein K6F30_06830 [Lachnospiraceae bacterium]|nr:hypothetical protein [Lachnospiraceae bacterium]